MALLREPFIEDLLRPSCFFIRKHYGCLFRYLSEIYSNFNYLEAPTISNGANRTQDVEEGADVLLDCDANGDPIPLVTWKRDGQILQQSNTTTSYFITNIKLRDAGNYVCTAKNRAGSVSQSILVRVTRCKYYLVPFSLPSVEFKFCLGKLLFVPFTNFI